MPWPGQPPEHGTIPREGIEGDEWDAYVTLSYGQDEHGIAYGTRVLWRRRSGSSRRSHARPGRTGEPSTGRSSPGDRIFGSREVCVTQNAETVLDVLRERGRRGLPLDELYRQLFNPQLYLLGLLRQLHFPCGLCLLVTA
jgi:hypothetical protein